MTCDKIGLTSAVHDGSNFLPVRYLCAPQAESELTKQIRTNRAAWPLWETSNSRLAHKTTSKEPTWQKLTWIPRTFWQPVGKIIGTLNFADRVLSPPECQKYTRVFGNNLKPESENRSTTGKSPQLTVQMKFLTVAQLARHEFWEW